MSTATPLESIPAPAGYSERQVRAALRVLDDLDRMDERMEAHFGRQREHERKSFRSIVALTLPALGGTSPESVQAYARNISRSGLSFIHPQELKHAKVLVCLDPLGASGNWFNGDVVRVKQIQEGFWEYGIRFRGKAMI